MLKVRRKDKKGFGHIGGEGGSHTGGLGLQPQHSVSHS